MPSVTGGAGQRVAVDASGEMTLWSGETFSFDDGVDSPSAREPPSPRLLYPAQAAVATGVQPRDALGSALQEASRRAVMFRIIKSIVSPHVSDATDRGGPLMDRRRFLSRLGLATVATGPSGLFVAPWAHHRLRGT